MNNKNQSGSIIVLILLVMTVLIIYCSNFARSTGFFVDIAGQRIRYKQQEWLTQGLLQYAITVCANEWKALKNLAKEGSKKQSITLTQWPLDKDKKVYSGKFCITINYDRALIQAFLIKNKKTICTYQCKLKKKKNNIEVFDWGYG